MNDFEKQEFWQALGRLYDTSLALRDATERLTEIARIHEHRLDRVEVTIEAIIEELRRRREQGEKGQ